MWNKRQVQLMDTMLPAVGCMGVASTSKPRRLPCVELDIVWVVMILVCFFAIHDVLRCVATLWHWV